MKNLREELIQKKLSLIDYQRDTKTREKFIQAQTQKNPEPIIQLLKNFDVGHVIELQHGGSNDFANLIFESKMENREPGQKRQIERTNQNFLSVGKQVQIYNRLQFDSRIPYRAPFKWTIEREISHSNGRLYKKEKFLMDATPYLEISTCKAVRHSLVEADFLSNSKDVVGCFLNSACIKALETSDEPGKKRANEILKTGLRVSSPFLVKTAVKITLDIAQTSPCLPGDVKKSIAKFNVSPVFNSAADCLAKISSGIILIREVKMKKN